MRKNMSKTDKGIRIIIALLVVIACLTGIITGIVATVIIALAVIFAIVSLLGICPICILYGTCPRSQKADDGQVRNLNRSFKS